jgi:hypothetical protein
MFIGHFGVALASKRVAPKPSLAWLFAACQLPDLLWPLFCLIGMEHFRIEPGNTAYTPLAFEYYPWSHSLLMDVVWAIALGLLYLGRRGDRRGAYVVGALVVSHWVLDWITHRPDMPILPNNDRLVGLGLWNNVAATVAVETVVFVAGIWLYLSLTTAKDRAGKYGFWGLMLFLFAINVANMFGPPPPSTLAVTVSALALWLVVAAAGWVDRHRAVRATA